MKSLKSSSLAFGGVKKALPPTSKRTGVKENKDVKVIT
jgi:hypothetical protein